MGNMIFPPTWYEGFESPDYYSDYYDHDIVDVDSDGDAFIVKCEKSGYDTQVVWEDGFPVCGCCGNSLEEL